MSKRRRGKGLTPPDCKCALRLCNLSDCLNFTRIAIPYLSKSSCSSKRRGWGEKTMSSFNKMNGKAYVVALRLNSQSRQSISKRTCWFSPSSLAMLAAILSVNGKREREPPLACSDRQRTLSSSTRLTSLFSWFCWLCSFDSKISI